MKKMLKNVGIAALAVICFSMIACDDSGGDGWTSEGGKLALTGLDDYNGKFIIVRKGTTFYAGDSYKASLVRGSAISDGSSELNAWEVIQGGQFIAYSKSDQITLEILVMAQQEYDMATLGQQLIQYMPNNLMAMTPEEKAGLNAIGVAALGRAPNVQFTNGIGAANIVMILPTSN